VIDQGSRKLDLKDMNFSAEQLKIFEDAYSSPYGMNPGHRGPPARARPPRSIRS